MAPNVVKLIPKFDWTTFFASKATYPIFLHPFNASMIVEDNPKYY
jgi:hypothetical protein